MGSCASVHRESGSAMKLGMSFGSKTDKVSSILPSPVKDKPATNGDRPINDQWSPARSTATAFRDYGTKKTSSLVILCGQTYKFFLCLLFSCLIEKRNHFSNINLSVMSS